MFAIIILFIIITYLTKPQNLDEHIIKDYKLFKIAWLGQTNYIGIFNQWIEL